jgi:acetyl esterase/lipase
MLRICALFVLFGVSAVMQAQEISVTPDVVYGHKHGMALTFDVFTPKNANGSGVLNIVSGGWRSRWRPHEESQKLYQPLLDEGFTVFAVRHGSSPKYAIPEIVPDVQRAARYIRLNATQLGVDANRLGVWGQSAGGHLSLMLGNASDNGNPLSEDPVLRVSDRVAAVAAIYPPVDFRPAAMAASPDVTNTRYPALDFIFRSNSDSSEIEAYSPIMHVSSDDPPTLLVHGDSDALVNVSNSYNLFAVFQDHNVESKLVIVPGADHGFHGDDLVLATSEIVNWFSEHLILQ